MQGCGWQFDVIVVTSETVYSKIRTGKSTVDAFTRHCLSHCGAVNPLQLYPPQFRFFNLWKCAHFPEIRRAFVNDFFPFPLSNFSLHLRNGGEAGPGSDVTPSKSSSKQAPQQFTSEYGTAILTKVADLPKLPVFRCNVAATPLEGSWRYQTAFRTPRHKHGGRPESLQTDELTRNKWQHCDQRDSTTW